jgi:hypothetical protein
MIRTLYGAIDRSLFEKVGVSFHAGMGKKRGEKRGEKRGPSFVNEREKLGIGV